MSGHGWVNPNPDGSKARCGGPAICPACAREKGAAEAAIAAKLTAAASGGRRDETPAGTLRRAAAAMRERAEGALCDGMCHTPWLVGAKADCGCCDVITDATGGRINQSDDRQSAHIASWHPGVALAVASWLESLNGVEWSEQGPASDELTHALKIARAYLGDS